MSVAYHILAYKNAAQVERLCRVLWHPHDTLVVHIDRRAPRDLHELAASLGRLHPNVFIQRSRPVVWGGPQISDLQIEAMSIALRESPSWTHFINLSGQDFPLCSRPRRLEAIRATPDQTFLTWFDPIATGQWRDARNRIGRWHFHGSWLQWLLRRPGLGRRLRAVLGWTNQLPYLKGYDRPPPTFFRYCGGANHGVFARRACQHLTAAPEAQRIRRWLSHAGNPDEIVFQSILLASGLAATLVNRDWREIDFPHNASHPRIFRLADFPRLSTSTNLFARKFDEEIDGEVVRHLERHIDLRNPSPVVGAGRRGDRR